MKVIRHADDFGYDADTTVTTIDCFRRGLLTSASIMAKMPATQPAIAFAKAHPEFSFGAHLVYVDGEHERPLCDPRELTSITDGEGRFLQTNVLRKKAILGNVQVADVARETEAQLAALRDCGVDLSHVDAHGHIHKLAPVRQALALVLPRFGIRRVRSVQNVFFSRRFGSATYWLGAYWERDIRKRWCTTEFFYMIPAFEEDGWWNRLDALFERPGTMEVGFHPGTTEPWRVRELRVVEAFTQACHARGVQ
ncbi:MAG: ChbG/HpnK family deacetylase, partial [Candidatus Acidiferrales bacterium]